MSRIGAVAIFFLALGVFVTLLFKSPETERAERPDAEVARLKKKLADMQQALIDETARSSIFCRAFEKAASTPNPERATPESLGADKTLAWLQQLDKRFKWLSVDRCSRCANSTCRA